MAMTLFAIGATGVISMQRVTMQGGEDARRIDVATNIANEWLSRLQRDSTFWTLPSSDDPTTSNLSTNTRWLGQIGPCAGTFCSPALPPDPAEGLSTAFDSFGRDLPSGTSDARYCVQYRLTWITDPGTAPNLKLTALMRAEVRVYWNRLEDTPIGSCPSGTTHDQTGAVVTGAPPEALPTTASPWHMVYAATAVRPNPRR